VPPEAAAEIGVVKVAMDVAAMSKPAPRLRNAKARLRPGVWVARRFMRIRRTRQQTERTSDSHFAN
jgi:hypothetical protein